MGYRPHRYPTMYPVTVINGDRSTRCFLTDITSTGCGVFEITDLNRGDVVIVKSAVGRLKATVQWAQDDQCGLKFSQPIGQRQMEQIRHAPTTRGPIHRAVHSFSELR